MNKKDLKKCIEVSHEELEYFLECYPGIVDISSEFLENESWNRFYDHSQPKKKQLLAISTKPTDGEYYISKEWYYVWREYYHSLPNTVIF